MTIDNPSQRADSSPLRRLFGSVFAILQTRLELAGIELAEEKSRLFSTLFFGLAAMMLATMALIALTALIAIVFWNTPWRWAALGSITGVYALAAIFCALRARRGLQQVPNIFEATLNEFEKDRELFRRQ
ncbi:phage holin family protein [Paraburkholderia bonniea]|uniref:phage holin family protein n=1 Tax=Paraburkholderia bonniea TaxID=2152891 RepID=UPI00129107DC|nr:phage holin family protein [Paraburkholderia bonniea]WJF90850.1 phage holin family protein [Paraburkholderia bonniea]WJF94164.1 phage holin family protein [Paraburkholderia bonniea]